MKNYKQTASDVLRLVGGEKNVVQVEHCSTRLRFTLADTSKADVAALKKTAGVKMCIRDSNSGILDEVGDACGGAVCTVAAAECIVNICISQRSQLFAERCV